MVLSDFKSNTAAVAGGIFLLVLGAGMSQFWSLPTAGAALQERVRMLEREAESSEVLSAKIIDKVDALQARVTSLEFTIGNMASQVAELKSEIIGLRADLALPSRRPPDG